MTTANNGGPAFPRPVRYQKHEYGRRQESVGWVAEGGEGGITMRDYFAAKAMQGLLGRDLELECDPDPHILAEFSYEIADAMLQAREAANVEG